jgi:hypothetical protein
MGEVLTQIVPTFIKSIRIEGRNERLSAETGALLLREADERLGLTMDITEKAGEEPTLWIGKNNRTRCLSGVTPVMLLCL